MLSLLSSSDGLLILPLGWFHIMPDSIFVHNLVQNAPCVHYSFIRNFLVGASWHSIQEEQQIDLNSKHTHAVSTSSISYHSL